MPGSLCQLVAQGRCWGQEGRGLGLAGRQTPFVGATAAADPGVTGTMGDCTHTGTHIQPCTHSHCDTHTHTCLWAHTWLRGTKASLSPPAASGMAKDASKTLLQGSRV